VIIKVGKAFRYSNFEKLVLFIFPVSYMTMYLKEIFNVQSTRNIASWFVASSYTFHWYIICAVINNDDSLNLKNALIPKSTYSYTQQS